MMRQDEVFLMLHKPEFVKMGKLEEECSYQIWDEEDEELEVMEEKRKFKQGSNPPAKPGSKENVARISWHPKIRMFPFQKQN